MKASAGFVSASALGMACGPAIAGLLQTNFKIYGLTFNQTTLPGWLMVLAWLIYLFWLWISFREPAHDTQESHVSQDARTGKQTFIINVLVQYKKPNLILNITVFSSFISYQGNIQRVEDPCPDD